MNQTTERSDSRNRFRTCWTQLKQLAPNIEHSVLIAMALIVLAVWAFGELAGEVVEGDTSAFDKAVLLSMRTPGALSDPIGPGWFEEMMRDFTAFGGVAMLVLLTLGIVIYLLLRRQRFLASFIFITIGGGNLLGILLKGLFERPRPDLVPHGSIVSLSSFPSGHAMLSAITYLTLGALLAHIQPESLLKRYIMGIAILITVLVGVSRVYLGVHWPTDVLAGWAVGASWALLSLLILDWLYKRRTQRAASASGS